MTAKVENYCATKQMKRVSVDTGEKVCINCIWYEQHYRRNRGNIQGWTPTCYGFCLQMDRLRGPLCRSCKKFETEGKSNFES